MKKMNMVEKFGAIKTMLNGEQVEGFSLAEALEFLDGRIAITEKKNASGNGERKPTKEQIANAGVKEQIVEFLRDSAKPVTIGEICKGVGIESNQKISALLTQLVKGGAVVRTEVKGKAHFALAEGVPLGERKFP